MAGGRVRFAVMALAGMPGAGAVCAGPGAGFYPGQTITVTVEPDTAPRIVDVPGDLQRALAKHAAARKAFESLSYSHRREHAQWVAGAKKEETRARRVARVIEMLKG